MADDLNKSRKRKIWITRYRNADAATEDLIQRIAEETGLSAITARLLWMRGCRSADDVTRFLRMEATSLHDPRRLKDMDAAVERLKKAVGSREKIVIYGDYDVDGVTSVSLLYLYLSECGADVDYYIPSRSEEGYGLSRMAIDRLRENHVDLIVTVDTGITANAEAEYAASFGIDMIITDHHECRAELPDACAVVNPHRPDDDYPFKGLAGVGVVFKLVCAYELAGCRERGIPESQGLWRVFQTYSDLVALGTVADVMPITDENRLIVAMGIRQMEQNCRLGLRALIDAASAGKEKRKQQKKITSTYIGFTIAPRINAAGRVSRATIAAQLLLSDDRKEADRLANQLCELNAERQAEENRITEEANRKIERMPEDERRYVLVLDDDHWHQGIIGIVASRMTEKYGLPSVLITYDGAVGNLPTSADIGKGSGRSIKGLNLVEALSSCEDLLKRFGGHELAAGLSVCRGNVASFRRRLNEYAADRLTEEVLCGTAEADCEVEAEQLTLKLAQELDHLEPFGVSNPVPCFILRNVKVLRIVPMGGGKHVKLILEKNGIQLQAVWFGVGQAELPFEQEDLVDLLFQLNINDFQNHISLQLILQDAALSGEAELERKTQAERYEEIRAGACFSASEQVLPSREDVAAVYTFLRRESRVGHTSFPIRRLMNLVRTANGSSLSYVKLKFIIRIMEELQLCGVSEPVPDHYLFDMFVPAKTDLERSSVLQALKRQQKKES